MDRALSSKRLISYHNRELLNSALDRLALLLRILEVPGSNFNMDTGYSEFLFVGFLGSFRKISG